MKIRRALQNIPSKNIYKFKNAFLILRVKFECFDIIISSYSEVTFYKTNQSNADVNINFIMRMLPFKIICGHKNNSCFCRGHTVQAVEESAECYTI